MEGLKKYLAPTVDFICGDEIYTGGINGSDENDYTDDPYGDNGWWNTNP